MNLDDARQLAKRAAAEVGGLAQISVARSASLDSSSSCPPEISLTLHPRLYADVRSRGLRMLLWLVILTLLAACGRPEIAPVEINPEDVCASCKMAISEKRFAAEFITKEGNAVKFDDIGCLQEYLKVKADRAGIAAYFVTDFESKGWIEAASAHFVKSAAFATPMGGNIAAFQTEEGAKEAAAKIAGQPLGFADVFEK
jgi:copper chaperone NosL